jgi:hypothetical protein
MRALLTVAWIACTFVGLASSAEAMCLAWHCIPGQPSVHAAADASGECSRASGTDVGASLADCGAESHEGGACVTSSSGGTTFRPRNCLGTGSEASAQIGSQCVRAHANAVTVYIWGCLDQVS